MSILFTACATVVSWPYSEGGQLLPGSVIRHYRRGHLVLPGVLPGVTWRVTWCYLGVTWALPGRYLGFHFGVFFFCGPKISAFLKLKLLEKNQFPPRDVTWAHACSRYLFTWPTLWPYCHRATTTPFSLEPNLPED